MNLLFCFVCSSIVSSLFVWPWGNGHVNHRWNFMFEEAEHAFYWIHSGSCRKWCIFRWKNSNWPNLLSVSTSIHLQLDIIINLPHSVLCTLFNLILRICFHNISFKQYVLHIFLELLVISFSRKECSWFIIIALYPDKTITKKIIWRCFTRKLAWIGGFPWQGVVGIDFVSS